MAFPFLYYSNFQREALRRGSCHRLWNVSYSNSRPPLPTNLQDEPKRMSATRRRAKTSPCARAPVLRSSQSGPCFPPASFATELQVIYEHSTGSGGVTGPGSNHSDAEPRPWLRIAPLPGARSRERSRWLRFAQTQAHSQSPPRVWGAESGGAEAVRAHRGLGGPLGATCPPPAAPWAAQRTRSKKSCCGT